MHVRHLVFAPRGVSKYVLDNLVRHSKTRESSIVGIVFFIMHFFRDKSVRHDTGAVVYLNRNDTTLFLSLFVL